MGILVPSTWGAWAHYRDSHVEPLTGDGIQRITVRHAPQTALTVAPSEPATCANKRLAAECGQGLHRLVLKRDIEASIWTCCSVKARSQENPL